MYTLFEYQQKIRDKMDDYFNHGENRLSHVYLGGDF